MAKQFHTFEISVGFGLTPTYVMNSPTNVMTDNDSCRLIPTFPTSYSEYIKSVDIGYTSADDVAMVESFDLSYDTEIDSYYFDISRTFTYHQRVSVQFRARYTDGQVVVDPTILTLIFRNAIKTTNLDTIDAEPTDTQTIILQNFVDAHANLVSSSITLGHVYIDNTTIKTNSSGKIYAVAQPPLVDNITIFIQENGELATDAVAKKYIYDEIVGVIDHSGLDNIDNFTSTSDGEGNVFLYMGDKYGETSVYSNTFEIKPSYDMVYAGTSEIYIDSLNPDTNFYENDTLYVWDDLYVGTGEVNDIAVDVHGNTHIVISDDEQGALYEIIQNGTEYTTELIMGGVFVFTAQLQITANNEIYCFFTTGDSVYTPTKAYIGIKENGTWVVTDSGLPPYSNPSYPLKMKIDSDGVIHCIIPYTPASLTQLYYLNNASGSFVIGDAEIISDAITNIDMSIDSNNKVHVSVGLDGYSGVLYYINNISDSWVTYTFDIDDTNKFYAYTSIDATYQDKVAIIYTLSNDASEQCEVQSLIWDFISWTEITVSGTFNHTNYCDVCVDRHGGVHTVYTVGGGNVYYSTLSQNEWVSESVALSEYGKAHVAIWSVYPRICFWNGKRIKFVNFEVGD